MGRKVMGLAIAPDVQTTTEDLAPCAGDATLAATNDLSSRVILFQRRIGGVLAAEYLALVRYSRRLTGNGPEAVDLVHIVVTRVLSQPTPVAAVGNLSGWLRTVLFHTFVDLRRHARWEIPTDSAALDRRSAAPEEEPPPSPITVDDVRALLATLPAHYRVPYELFTFESMSYARIAAELGISCTTVGTRINRARNRLRSLIRADGER